MKRNRRVARRVMRAHNAMQHVSIPMHPQPEHIPTGYELARRPTRDDREEERLELRTADGRVMALVERVDPASLPN
jgi:hypothetical protein